MKVAVVLSAFFPCTDYGGPASVAAGHISNLDTEHDFTVLTSNLLSLSDGKFIKPLDKKIKHSGNLTVKYYKSNLLFKKFSGLFSFEFIVKSLFEIRKNDLVHIHFAREFFPIVAAVVCMVMRKPYIIQTHGMVVPKTRWDYFFFDLLTAHILRSAEHVLYLQELEMRQLSKFTSSNLLELMNGIEYKENIERDENNLTTASINDTVFKMLFLARLHPRKRVLRFIEIIHCLRLKGMNVKARIVGPDEGDLKNAYDLISRLSLKEFIDIKGAANKEEVDQHYAWADALLVTSKDEPFPMTILEAMSKGVVSIITRQIQNHKLLNYYESVILIDEDIDIGAEEIIDAMNNKNLLDRTRKNAKRLIGSELNIIRITRRLDVIYRMGRI